MSLWRSLKEIQSCVNIPYQKRSIKSASTKEKLAGVSVLTDKKST